MSESNTVANPSIQIIIVGAGVVGQATGKGLLQKGHRVAFVDIKESLVDELNQQGYTAYSWKQIQDLTSIPRSRQSHIVSMFCVSTPSRQDGSIEMGYLLDAVSKYAEAMRNGAWLSNSIVIRSTVPPGTTRSIVQMIEKISGKKVGHNFDVCVQPEFLRAKSSVDDFLNAWAIVIGQYNEDSARILKSLYEGWPSEIYLVDLETAEFMKYIHNCYNAVKISFSNEMWMMGKQLGLDANVALNLASKTAEGFWNPRYGTTGGYPYGGMCLPKDTKAFLAWSKERGVSPKLISAAEAVNEQVEVLASKGRANVAKEHGLNWLPSPLITNKLGHNMMAT